MYIYISLRYYIKFAHIKIIHLISKSNLLSSLFNIRVHSHIYISSVNINYSYLPILHNIIYVYIYIIYINNFSKSQICTHHVNEVGNFHKRAVAHASKLK